jgi:hypothetical protein
MSRPLRRVTENVSRFASLAEARQTASNFLRARELPLIYSYF